MADILNVKNISAGYGEAHVLHGVSFEMQPGTTASARQH